MTPREIIQAEVEAPAKPSIEEWREARREHRIWAQATVSRLARDQFAKDWTKDPAVILMSVVRETLWWIRWVMLAAWVFYIVSYMIPW